MEQTDPRTGRTPARLAFADHMNRFVAGDRAPSSQKERNRSASSSSTSRYESMSAWIGPNSRWKAANLGPTVLAEP